MADNDNEQPRGGNSTPLLFLLDGVLSQDDDRVNEAVNDIQRLVPNMPLLLHSTTGSTIETLSGTASAAVTPCTSSAMLCQIVTALLEHCPEFASMRSEHDGSLPLHFAASLGNVQVAQSVFEKYPLAASSPNDKGKIPLHYAAREGRSVEMVNFFLRASPETCAMATSKGKLAVHFAAGDGHAAITSALLRQYPQSAALPSSKGKLPLHFCARWGYLEIAHELIQFYPDSVRALDWEGSLPLHDAAREGQYRMSRYLIERFPAALQTANLRGEIPLFPAVRSTNVELVLLMIQAWPRGGKHILRNVSADDNVSSWNTDILELLLRGSVNIFFGCTLLQGHEPPTVQLTDDLQPEELMTMATNVAGSTKLKQTKLTTLTPTGPVGTATSVSHHPYQPRLVAVATSPIVTHLGQANAGQGCFIQGGATRVSPISATLKRSKSPILNGENGGAAVTDTPSRGSAMTPGKKKNSRKRSRHGSSVPSDAEVEQRTFIPLHAAFECKAASHVIQHILKEHVNDLLKMDEQGRLALHWAVTHCHNQDAIVDLVLNTTGESNKEQGSSPALFITPQAASTRDVHGKLPLHLAIESCADVRIIAALLEAFPSAGVEPCSFRTRTTLASTVGDCFFLTPVEMATQCGCDLSTVFVLLRIDPSFINRSLPDKATALG